MTKYDPLTPHLRTAKTNTVTLSFPEVEVIIGAPLPRSAHEYREWWANQSDTSNRPQAHSWLTAGFVVDAVCQNGPSKWVRFKRA